MKELCDDVDCNNLKFEYVGKILNLARQRIK